jgi:hypothetical protein
MGTIYEGPYAEEIGYDKHEGYAVALLATGADAGDQIWLAYEDQADHLAASCACGWRGAGRYAVTEAGEDQAVDEWRRQHLQPLIDQAQQHSWPEWARRTRERTSRVAEDIAAGRYADAAILLERMSEDLAARQRIAAELTDTG